MTLEEAKALRHGQVIYTCGKNADGSWQRWRVTGGVKTWKRDPERVQVPIKHGLRHFGYVLETGLRSFFTSEAEATAVCGMRAAEAEGAREAYFARREREDREKKERERFMRRFIV